MEALKELHRYFDETMLANFKLLPELRQESLTMYI